jgi:iron complex outermembrane receptor protein
MVYVGYAHAEKSGGINMAGLPTDSAGDPVLSTAVVGPEAHSTFEAGIKARTLDGALTVNIDVFRADVTDFQANRVDTVAPAALRTYLANIPKVRVQGIELDAALRVGSHLRLWTSGAYTDSQYGSYPNGPCPIEKIGSGTSACDLTGVALPGTPTWSGSWGGDYGVPLALGPATGEAFLRWDMSAKTSVNGDSTGSPYMRIPGYALVNASIGYRTGKWDIALFARNLFDADYLQNVAAQSGNSGLIVGTPSDPRIMGVTLRARL